MKTNLTKIAAMAIMLMAIFLSPIMGYTYQDNYVLQNATYTWMNPVTIGFTQINNAGDLKTDNNASHMLTTTKQESTGALPIQIHLSDNGVNLNSGNWFTSFCVDIYQDISATTYNTPVSLVAPSAVYGGLQAAWLYERYYKAGDTAAIGGLQIAIWETVVDDYKNYDLTKGNFYIANNSLNAAALAKANTFLADLKTNFDPAGLNSMYAIMHSSLYQDQLIKYSLPGAVGDPPAGTPEPATMFLMGIGMIGLAGLRKFRKN